MKKAIFSTLFLLLSLASFCRVRTIVIGPEETRGGKELPQAVSRTLYELSADSYQKIDTVEIVLRGGVYGLEKTIEIGSFPVFLVIRAMEGEVPVLSGERTLKFSKGTKRLRASGADEAVSRIGKPVMFGYGSVIGRRDRAGLYWNGRLLTPARWPDSGFVRAGKVLGTIVVKRDGPRAKEGIFSYTQERIDRWARERHGAVAGYFHWDWCDAYQEIKSIDPITRTITLSPPDHIYGYVDGFRFYGFNLLCELDSPGEYYVDADDGRVWLCPPEGWKASDRITWSEFGLDQMLSISGASGVTVKGLSFAGGRNGAVYIVDSENITLKDCTVERFGDDAVTIRSSRWITVDGCTFRELGHKGISAEGGDKGSLAEAMYRVTGTTFSRFSLYTKTYQPAVLFKGCGMLLDGCDISDAPSSGIRLEGSLMTVENNYFHDLVKESDDQGALDIFLDYSHRGVVIRNNLWQDITGDGDFAVAGVRLDDMISGARVEDNVFIRVGATKFGGVQIHGGKDNIVKHNLFFDCNAAVSFSPWGKARWMRRLGDDDVAPNLVSDGNVFTEPYLSRFPELQTDITENIDRNYILDNLIVNSAHRWFNSCEANVFSGNMFLPDTSHPADRKRVEAYLDGALSDWLKSKVKM